MKPTASQARDSVIPITGKSTDHPVAGIYTSGDESSDHFVRRNGIEYAGTHLILDLWEANHLDQLELMEAAMRKAVDVCGATLLHIHLHHFTPNNGISGIAVLAESHISVHTWPERQFAAFDIFMCGNAEPELAIPVLNSTFNPGKIYISEHLRGISDKR
jgi:S-adenosylmethionine decarboxylase